MSKICKLLMSILLISILASALVIPISNAKIPNATPDQSNINQLTEEEIKILKELIQEIPQIPPELTLNSTERMRKHKVPEKVINLTLNQQRNITSNYSVMGLYGEILYTNPISKISVQGTQFDVSRNTNDYINWVAWSVYIPENSFVNIDVSGTVGNFRYYVYYHMSIDDVQYTSVQSNYNNCRDTGWFSSQTNCDNEIQKSQVFYLTKGWHTIKVNGYAIRGSTSYNDYYWVHGSISLLAFPEYTALQITSPNGGETWSRGSTKTISWNIYGRPATNVKIELYKGISMSTVIASNTSNDGTYSWYIPSYQPTGSDYKIKITSIEESKYYDWSDKYFNII